ncbi:MAG: hypothetical protein WCX31_15975 [Salinivirgaceae bacterium]|jgi:5'(3')-deoxyribonucleotidase
MDRLVIYIDMDDVLCDYRTGYENAINKNPKIVFPQSQYGFFRNLLPIEGAIDAIKHLSSQVHFEIYILTAPSILNPLCYTEKRLWVEDYFGLEMVNRLIITPNKGLNKGDYLIDDYDSENGQENFEGILLKFGSKEFPNWPVVLNYFKGKYLLTS